MKNLAAAIVFMFVSFSAKTVFAERSVRRIEDDISVTREVSRVNVVYRPRGRMVAEYARRLHSGPRTRREEDTLFVFNSSTWIPDATIVFNPNTGEVIFLNLRFVVYMCNDEANAETCRLASGVVRAWREFLDVERRIRETLEVVPDLEIYMPPRR